jgi:F0F1-type ATP synthase membrane subunit b/b'
MNWDLFSFFLNSEEPFIEFNTNILETNVVNILLLFGLLFYGNISFSKSLKERQEEIIQTIENAQKDVLDASNYYDKAERGFTQSLFWLQSWKTLYDKEKVEIVQTKYKRVKVGLAETFAATETLITKFENRTFVDLQQYIIFITASKILRKFLSLSQIEKTKLLETTINELMGEPST